MDHSFKSIWKTSYRLDAVSAFHGGLLTTVYFVAKANDILDVISITNKA